MKKFMYQALLLISLTYQHHTARADNASKHYVVNLTGRTLLFNFYRKAIIGKDNVWNGSAIVGPMLIGGKNVKNAADYFTASLLPEPIRMWETICFQMTINACKLNSSTSKDTSIKGITIPVPGYSLTPNDYKVELQGNQLIVKKLSSYRGLPITGGKEQQWPSAQDLTVSSMTSEQKLAYRQKQIQDLTASIASLNKEIKKYRKAGDLTKLNNRKRMRANKEHDIKRFTLEITNLQNQINVPATPVAKIEDNVVNLDEKIDVDTTENTSEDQELYQDEA